MAERILGENLCLTYCVEETAEIVFEMWWLWVVIKQGNWQRIENWGLGIGCRGEENLKGV